MFPITKKKLDFSRTTTTHKKPNFSEKRLMRHLVSTVKIFQFHKHGNQNFQSIGTNPIEIGPQQLELFTKYLLRGPNMGPREKIFYWCGPERPQLPLETPKIDEIFSRRPTNKRGDSNHNRILWGAQIWYFKKSVSHLTGAIDNFSFRKLLRRPKNQIWI